MLIVLFVVIGIAVGLFGGYAYAYSEIVNKAFSSKANNEPMEIISGGKKAVVKVEHIEAEG